MKKVDEMEDIKARLAKLEAVVFCPPDPVIPMPELIKRAKKVLVGRKFITISRMQRLLHLGYNRTADLIEELVDLEVLGAEPVGIRGRRVLLT